MRVTALLGRLLCLPNTTVRDVEMLEDRVLVHTRTHHRRLRCPHCDHSTRHRYDTRDVDSSWRHLDVGGRLCMVTARRSRLRCPEHGVLAGRVDFARPGSRFTRDFEDLTVWLAAMCAEAIVSLPGMGFRLGADFLAAVGDRN